MLTEAVKRSDCPRSCSGPFLKFPCTSVVEDVGKFAVFVLSTTLHRRRHMRETPVAMFPNACRGLTHGLGSTQLGLEPRVVLLPFTWGLNNAARLAARSTHEGESADCGLGGFQIL